MASHLGNIIGKELREIFRDPRLFIGMIIVPVIMFPLMGGAVSVSMEATSKQLDSMKIGLQNNDPSDGYGNWSDALFSILVHDKMVITNISGSTTDEAIANCQKTGINTLIFIPTNFSERIDQGNSSPVHIYQVLVRYDIGEAASSERLSSSIATFNAYVTIVRLKTDYPNSDNAGLLQPTSVNMHSIVHGKVQDTPPSAIITSLMSTSLSMPIVIMLLIIMAGQLAATSVAMEKEQKTLEVLLTLPIKRIYILLGKIAGVVVVSLVATLAYVAGFTYYMSSITSKSSAASVDLTTVGLSPDPTGFALMAISLFLSFLSALSIAVMIAAYTKDVRSAQSLMGVLYIPIIIPAFILMFAPIEILPMAIQGALYALPFTYPTLAAKALYTKEYLTIIFGIFYQIIFTFAVLYIASKFYDSEKVLTAKFEFGKKRKNQAQE